MTPRYVKNNKDEIKVSLRVGSDKNLLAGAVVVMGAHTCLEHLSTRHVQITLYTLYLTNTPLNHILAQFTDEETEAQGGSVFCS